MIAICALAASLAAPPAAGQELLFDAQPVTLQGHVLVPLRALFEWAGGTVLYQAGHITARGGGGAGADRLELWVNKKQARLGNTDVQLDIAPTIVDGRVMVPLRFSAEAFGAWVKAQGRQIELSLPQLNRTATMAIPPAPDSLLGKMWRVASMHYGLVAPPKTGSKTPHFDLYSPARQAALKRELGKDAAQKVEEQTKARAVAGLRVEQDFLAEDQKHGWLVACLRAGPQTQRQKLSFVLERTGWRLDQVEPAP